MAIDVEVARPAAAQLGEGPAWDGVRGALIWVDILGRAVHLELEDGPRSFATPEPVGAAVPTADGRLLLVMGLTLATLDVASGAIEELARVDGDPDDLRFNDAKADPEGRLWAGTMAYDERPGVARLYRVGADARPAEVLDGLTIANGMAWSADRMFHIDSPTRTVAVHPFDRDSGELGPREVAVDTSAHAGVPDGMCRDDDGNLWVAFHGGGAVRCFSPAGELLEQVELPVELVTSCCFGGPDGDRLHITTSREGLDAHALAAQPLAGALFVAQPGVRGPAATPVRLER